MNVKKLLSLCMLFSVPLAWSSIPADLTLRICWNKMVKPLQGKYLCITYHEELHELSHNFDPWQQTHYTGNGTVWCNGTNFLRQDTLTAGKRTYYSKTQFDGKDLLFLDYGDKDLYAVTESMFADQVHNAARYSPVLLIDYCLRQKITPGNESTGETAVFTITIAKTVVRLYIRRSDQLLEKVTTLSADDLYGDVLTMYSYSDYALAGNVMVPKSIRIEKINGKIMDEITIRSAAITASAPQLLEKPAAYTLVADAVPVPEIKVEKYSEHIHFIEMGHTQDRVLVVEFSDFVLIAEAPLSSDNGELIISEVKKIIPGKPVRYFVFGHHHPHYLGGIRPFVHKRAIVICRQSNKEYVEYIVNAPHTLQPDSLQLQPVPLQLEEMGDSKTITDGNYTMQIYFIGKKSEHTNDYLVYYFPEEKMLFEDDLVWIPKEGELKKAGTRQAGLYNAVKELGLDINTVVQSWPTGGYDVKTIIPFEELGRSVNMK